MYIHIHVLYIKIIFTLIGILLGGNMYVHMYTLIFINIHIRVGYVFIV